MWSYKNDDNHDDDDNYDTSFNHDDDNNYTKASYYQNLSQKNDRS